jgi:L-ribulokinase
VAGVVDGSVLPGYIGIEAGQAAVGDLLNWFVSKVLQKDDAYHKVLSEKASPLKAGQSGLLALDWNNGNRNVLADQKLTGLILGQTINTTDYEIYRALIEATAFGALKIIERIESYGIKIKRVINCGGIAHKNPLFMQIYANVINRPMEISESEETVALGAAIMGGYCPLKGTSGFETVEAIQKRVCRVKEKIYSPQPDEVGVYKELYQMYSTLHDAFGIRKEGNELYDIMKKLLAVKANPDA